MTQQDPGLLLVITFGQPHGVIAAQRLGYFAREGLAVGYAQTRASTEQPANCSRASGTWHTRP